MNTARRQCPECDGEGEIRTYSSDPASPTERCFICDGTGEIAMPDRDMNGDLTIAAYEGQNKALNRRNREAIRLLRQSYVTLAFAFHRLHQSARSRDGELCQDFQKVRAEIEAYFKEIGAPL